MEGEQVDLKAITDSAAAAGSGVPEAERLLAFADAAVGVDDAALDEARDALEASCGPEVLIDTAAVVANFQRMVRIADSTGIPLGEWLEKASRDVRKELGLEE